MDSSACKPGACELQRDLAQRILLDLLQSELDTCFAELKAPEISPYPEHRNSGLAKVREALQFIREFERGIDDPRWRETIHTRADELEKALAEILPILVRVA